jgi:ABC-2 type transport system ATP-binding protein
MEETPVAVDVRNLFKRYGSRRSLPDSLSDISFQVPLGKICCLLGPNGSGKTTLLKILAGLLQPTSGSVALMGLDPAKKPREAKLNVGWMPAEERSGFYGRLTGRENLQFFAALQGVPAKELDRITGNLALQIGIKDEIDQTVLKVSSGAKQKIGLARAMLHNPSILLLDEPTRNLDPHTILRFRRLIRDHLTRLQKKTIVLSTHSLEEARRVADIVIIMGGGKVLRILQDQELESELKHTSLEDLYLKTVDAAEREA